MKNKIIVKFLVFILCVSAIFPVSVSAKELRDTKNNCLVPSIRNNYDPHPIDVEFPE